MNVRSIIISRKAHSFTDLNRILFVSSLARSLNNPHSYQCKLLRSAILLSQIYRANIKFIKDMPRMPKKKRYVKSAIVGRDISNGTKLAALIVLEDEIELCAYDI